MNSWTSWRSGTSKRSGFIRDEIVLAPLPHDRGSLDLLRGSGRAWSSLGECGHHPCAEQILAAQARHGRAMLKVGQYSIMPCHWKRPSQYTVSASQAAALSRLLDSDSTDACKEALKDNCIIESMVMNVNALYGRSSSPFFGCLEKDLVFWALLSSLIGLLTYPSSILDKSCWTAYVLTPQAEKTMYG